MTRKKTAETSTAVDTQPSPTLGEGSPVGDSADNETSPTGDEPQILSVEERRQVISLVTADGLNMISTLEGLSQWDDLLEYVLQAICTELFELSCRYETETVPAVHALGQLVGGLFGSGTVAEEETLRSMHDTGTALREHLAETIGLPPGVGRVSLEDQRRARAERASKRRADREEHEARMARIDASLAEMQGQRQDSIDETAERLATTKRSKR